MRSLVVDKLQSCDLVAFNRVTADTDRMPLHKLVRGVSRNTNIVYDMVDGSIEYDTIEDPLPFDINAPVIEIKDEDYALWYRDVTEEPEKYDGKTVRFKAQVAMLRRDKDNMFAPGRFVMTCCVDDIQFCGLPCKWADAAKLKSRSWVMVEAKISAEKHRLYKGDLGPVLTAISVTDAAPAVEWLRQTAGETDFILRVPEEVTMTPEQEAAFFGISINAQAFQKTFEISYFFRNRHSNIPPV